MPNAMRVKSRKNGVTHEIVRYVPKRVKRGIKFQNIDIVKYGMSKGEFQSVKAALGGIEPLIDIQSKEYENNHIKHLACEEDKEERLFSNPAMFKTPIVRNGRMATVGYVPEVWKSWV